MLHSLQVLVGSPGTRWKYLDTCEMTSGVCGMKSGGAAETMKLTMITTCLEDIDGRLH